MPPRNSEVLLPQIETLDVRIRGLDEKFTLLMAEAEKRNGQRFDAQQEGVTVALVAQEKAVLAAMAAAEKAVTKAELAAERRFESVNEFRQTLSDQTATFLPRPEYAAQHNALVERMDLNANRMALLEKMIGDISSRGSGRNDIWLIIVAVIAVLLPVVLHYLPKSG